MSGWSYKDKHRAKLRDEHKMGPNLVASISSILSTSFGVRIISSP